MIKKDFPDIKLEDIQYLLDNSISESKDIEYKLGLGSGSDNDKKEFLADISSFANTNGGDILYGIKEKNGCPVNVEGVKVTDLDGLIASAESAIRDGIEPRIDTQIRGIKIEKDKYVMVIRIKKSWIGPHRVTFKGHDKFYARHSAGKYPLDVSELRVAFNLSETANKKINDFRNERISMVINNQTPVLSTSGAKIILHIIPISAFTEKNTFNVTNNKSLLSELTPICSSGWSDRINLDGYVTYTSPDQEGGICDNYTQIFHSGIIEAVDSRILSPRSTDQLIIPSLSLEEQILKSYEQYLSALNNLGVKPPFVFGLTLTGVKGYKMGISQMHSWMNRERTIDRELLKLPEILIESYNEKPSSIVKSTFDLIWNACGHPQSMYFDEKGEWTGKSTR